MLYSKSCTKYYYISESSVELRRWYRIKYINTCAAQPYLLVEHHAYMRNKWVWYASTFSLNASILMRYYYTRHPERENMPVSDHVASAKPRALYVLYYMRHMYARQKSVPPGHFGGAWWNRLKRCRSWCLRFYSVGVAGFADNIQN